MFIFYEGPDDLKFIDNIIKPIFRDKGTAITPIDQYLKKRTILASFIKSISSIPSSSYIFMKDLDTYPCIFKRKESIDSDLSHHIDVNKILIVEKEIESWYLAGTDRRTLRRLKVEPRDIDVITKSTDNIDCNRFNHFFPRKISRSEILDSLLINYDINVAELRNKSFRYFLQKIDNYCIDI
jgi:hypothetical protein